MRPLILTLGLVGAAAGLAAGASRAPQSAGRLTVTPFSDFRDQTGYDGAESPNGKFFATADLSDNYVVFNRSTGKWTTDSTLKVWQMRWSPDGRFMSFSFHLPGTPARDRYVWVVPMDTVTGRPRGTPRRISMRKGWFSEWSPDGRRIAFVSEDSGFTRIIAVPFNGGDEEILYETRGVFGPPNYKRIIWSPDGSTILSPAATTYWSLLNIKTHKLDSLGLAAMQNIGYSRDGKRIAQFHYQFKLIVISSAENGRELQRFDLPQRVFPTGWSATVPNALTGIHNPIPGDVRRISLPDGAISAISPVSDELGVVKLSPDGKQVAFQRYGMTSTTLFISNVDGSGVKSLATGGAMGSVHWSPDGKRVTYVTSPVGLRRLHVVDVATGSSRVLVSASPLLELAGTSWRSDGQAIRYEWWPRGRSVAEREVRETTLAGDTRTLARIPVVAADLNTSRQTRMQFINDTLALLRGGGVTALNLRTGATKSLLSGDVREIDDFGVSPDGKSVTFSLWKNDRATPVVLSLATGETREIPYTLGAELGEIRFHPDGRHLVATACTQCNDDERWDVVLLPLNGDQTRVLTANQKDYRSFGNISVTPDGRSVIFSGEKSWTMRLVTVTLPTK